MPDPTGANLTDAEVKRIEFADPHFQKYKLADRLQELREDIERGEVHGVMTLALTADHTLVAPGGSAAADATVITSGHILVSTDGSTRALTLPDPTKFKGKLTIWKTSGVGDLTVQHRQPYYSK